MGESVCRPVSGALIAELFPPTSRYIVYAPPHIKLVSGAVIAELFYTYVYIIF